MEYANTNDRQNAGRTSLTPELREALVRLRAGATCETWSSPASVVRGRQLRCALCARWATIRRRAAEMRAPRR